MYPPLLQILLALIPFPRHTLSSFRTWSFYQSLPLCTIILEKKKTRTIYHNGTTVLSFFCLFTHLFTSTLLILLFSSSASFLFSIMYFFSHTKHLTYTPPTSSQDSLIAPLIIHSFTFALHTSIDIFIPLIYLYHSRLPSTPFSHNDSFTILSHITLAFIIIRLISRCSQDTLPVHSDTHSLPHRFHVFCSAVYIVYSFSLASS